MAKTKKAAAPKPIDGEQVKALRKKSGLNQRDWWTLLGVTQSGGSRYESGRAIPKPVQLMIPIVHFDEAAARAQFDHMRKQVDQLRSVAQ